MTQYSLALANGSTVVQTNLTSDQELPYHQLSLEFTSQPSAGTLTVEYQVAGDTTWNSIPEAKVLKLLSTSLCAFYAKARTYRFTLAGVTGGSGMIVNISNLSEWPADGIPQGAFLGLRAITSQNYTEANVKNGVQYEVAALSTTVAANGTIDTLFTTGSLPVIIKARQVDFNGTSARANVYRSPTFTGGTPVTYYNLNDISPVAGTVVIRSGGTVTSVGTEFGAPSFYIGTDGQANNKVGTYATLGNERILRPNTTYLLRLTNTSAAAMDIATYLSWYEGGTDLPRNN